MSALSDAATVKELGTDPGVLSMETLSLPAAATPRTPWLNAALISSTMMSDGSRYPKDMLMTEELALPFLRMSLTAPSMHAMLADNSPYNAQDRAECQSGDTALAR